MFTVDGVEFGRISWYYQEVTGQQTESGALPFIPRDLGARWILRNASWEKGARIAAVAGENQELSARLREGGWECPVWRAEEQVAGRYHDGGCYLGDAGQLLEFLQAPGNQRFHESLLPFSRLFVAVEMTFASNNGFQHVCSVAAEEHRLLALSVDGFQAELAAIPRSLALGSPAVLARMICRHLHVRSEPSFGPLVLERFVFDPDILISPVGAAINSHDAALHVSQADERPPERRGMMLLCLTRSENI